MNVTKLLIPFLSLVAFSACGNTTQSTREELDRAEQDLVIAKADAAQQVGEAQVAAAAKVDKAAADVADARAELQVELDRIDAEIVVLEKTATTPEQKDEIVEIRKRQNTIVVKVRDHDKNGITWSEVESEVKQTVADLGRDIETTRVKISEKKR